MLLAEPGRLDVRTGSRRRRVRILAWAMALGVAAFSMASSLLFVWPRTSSPQAVDAIVSLDGTDERGRADQAIKLAEQGYSHLLLFSQGSYRSTPCPVVAHTQVVCFEPVPGRTVGEVEWVAQYARSHGLRSLILVPGRPQSVRAGILMRRCFAGRVLVVPPGEPWSEVPHDVIYEWGALAKALVVDTHC